MAAPRRQKSPHPQDVIRPDRNAGRNLASQPPLTTTLSGAGRTTGPGLTAASRKAIKNLEVAVAAIVCCPACLHDDAKGASPRLPDVGDRGTASRHASLSTNADDVTAGYVFPGP